MARKPKKASRSSSKGDRGGLLSSNTLLLVQTVLLVGLAKETLEWIVLERLLVPSPLKVILGMVVVAGTLGGLVVLAERRLQRVLALAHRKAQRRYRLPALLWHLLSLTLIFMAYAAFWNEETGAIDDMRTQLAQWWDRYQGQG